MGGKLKRLPDQPSMFVSKVPKKQYQGEMKIAPPPDQPAPAATHGQAGDINPGWPEASQPEC